ncbi:hypothetical protein RCO48_19820 [Peribacillus frigoritolerans]|nr:hypothetical protein [Peribacillus frigoritolerans]
MCQTLARKSGTKADRRGMRVPYVPINVPIVQAIKIDKLDFHRVCLQYETINKLIVFFILLGMEKNMKESFRTS